LNGIYLHTTEVKGKDVLRSVATDGHRLALLDTDCPAGAKGMPGVIIPRKLILELRKLLDEISSEIKVEVSESKIRFSFGNIVMTSKIIEGKFPNYEKVIPVGNDKLLELDTKLFAIAVDRISSVTGDKTKAVKLHISRAGLKISENSPETGSGDEEIDGTYNSDDSIEVGFNARYLIDIADQIEGKNIRFTMADSASPALISEIDNEQSVYVLMPMRI
jgi:DNA polymerase-3 subunit beta